MKRCIDSDEELTQNDNSEYDTSDSETELSIVEGRPATGQTNESTCNYIAESQSIISTSAKSTSTTQQALAINKKLQEYLKIVKTNLEAMLEKCQQKYKQNEIMYEQIRNKTEKLKLGRQHLYYLCGHPFFKDERQFSAPPNPDYLYRKKTLKELFPMDLRDYTINWNTKDKIFLIQGVKQQIIAAIASHNRDNARKTIKCTRVGGKQKKLEVLMENKTLEKLMLSELYEMLAKAKINFKIDWFTISTEKLDDRHEPAQCMALWNGYLKPSLNRNRWTNDEEEQLLQLVPDYNYQNWTEIANHLPGRSSYQCFVHYQSVLSVLNVQRNVRFTAEEDKLLMDNIEKYRIGSVIPWSTIVERMPGRTKTQVYNRYMFSIKPGIKKDKFTIEEDCILTAAVKEYGTNFFKFPRDLLPGRTIVQIRNRYNNVLKFVGRNGSWTPDSDEILMKLVEKHGTSAWKIISSEMDNKYSRLACRGRYLTITKYLKKHPNSTIANVPTKRFTGRTNVTENNWMETIIRVKQAQQQGFNIDDMKPIISANMPALSLDIFHYFKYAYRFKFQPICLSDRLVTDTNHVVGHLLQNKICAKDYKILMEPQGGIIDMEYNKFADCIPVHIDYVFPPSWCTSLLFRGLSIMFADSRLSPPSIASSTSAVKTKQEYCNEELQLFRQRLFSLLYSTIICSKLELPSIENGDNDDDSDSDNDDELSDNETEINANECDDENKEIEEISMQNSSYNLDTTYEDEDESIIEITDYKISPHDMIKNLTTSAATILISNDDDEKPCTSQQALTAINIINKCENKNQSPKTISYTLQSSNDDANYQICLLENDSEAVPTSSTAIKRSGSPPTIDDCDTKTKRIKHIKEETKQYVNCKLKK